MLQLTQNLKTGKMEVVEAPFPSLSYGKILVRNAYSLISAGTEMSKVSTARKGYIGKAKEKPEQIKQVMDTLRREGIRNTYSKVMNKLDSLNPLGYSCAGEIIEVGDGVTKFSVGDRVACGGQDIANHAEIVAIPENLAVKIPANVELEEACYTTVSAIALQGIRQADLRLGENCVVIGLGLLGQITIKLLKASGIRVAGIDINPKAVDLALKSGADFAMHRNCGELDNSILNFSDGYGVDAVIITAGSSSLDPVELAGKLCRTKGKVIIVGAVPTGFSRANYYNKELELKMSCSYGPGRYNVNYEEKGLDYPIGYVRWTENRNMKAFLQLISSGKVSIKDLTTHTYDFSQAITAYEMLLKKKESFVGILLRYDIKKEVRNKVTIKEKYVQFSDINIGFIGAGSFAQNYLLPNIKDANLISVATSTSHNAKNIAQKYGFIEALNNPDELIKDKRTNTIFIATRHDTHAEYVLKALRANKNVFVEKPLCLFENELEEIRTEYEKNKNHIMVGFNRRFAPQIQELKRRISSENPKAINYRVNAGFIPQNHWIQDKEIGGGRILGEVCHFVDLVMFIAGSAPESLFATAMEDPAGLLDTLNVNIKFKNGSIANVAYFSNGSKELNKEYLEVFSAGVTFIIDDYKELGFYSKSKKTEKLSGQNKGHKEEVQKFLDSIRHGGNALIPFNEIYYSTKMSFDIIKSIRNRTVIKYDE